MMRRDYCVVVCVCRSMFACQVVMCYVVHGATLPRGSSQSASAGKRPTSVPASSATLPHATPSRSATSTPRSSDKETRKKDRSRSKSPFRSFRWKKGTSKSSGPASDDEGNLERVTERTSPSGEEEIIEGNLVRKHEWESAAKKASNRSWDKVFCIARGMQIAFYKDSKTAKSTPEQCFKGESPMDLTGATVKVADDYTKKKHVFRIRFAAGSEYLFQAHDDAELSHWVAVLNKRCASDSAGPSRSQTLPASGQKDEPKRRSFFTLKKV